MLGSAVAARLLARGFEVAGHDTRPEQVTALASSGLRLAASVTDAMTAADAVFTILPTPAAVEAVWLAPGGLLEAAAKSTVLLQMSTVSPALAARLGADAASRGLSFLDTPISGTSTMVARGQCTILVGGDAALAETCRPLFDAIASTTVHVGAAGEASVAKLAANMLGGLSAIALAEALVLGAKAGVEPARLLEVLKQTPVRSGTMDTRGPQMVSHRFEPHIRLDLFLKDFRLMLEEGQRLGVPLPLTSVAHQLCTAASAAGHGAEDLSAVITTLETLAGMRT
ncbi:MAG: NAD(P)-dependent oxidoreductase [Candidatus Rokubacteria bacterium]|nr:NAD(P)-dependent oxidoreductase [Candidatus Rokubacteria bacterium]MBI3827254.1 NAD(P)-dependent oxidoreductase [Candidatus Rokubacteria bacterium]